MKPEANEMKTNYPIEKPEPRKSREELDAEIKAFLANGGKVQDVNRGASTLNGMPILRPKVRN